MEENLIKIGNKIKSLRESTEMTQKALASFLEVDQSLISKFESGERNISVDMLEKIGVLFGVGLSAFNDGVNIVKPLSLNFRTNKINDEDLKYIYAINKIALNGELINAIIDGDVSNENTK